MTAAALGLTVLALLFLRQNVILILAVATAMVHVFVASKSSVGFLLQDIWTSMDREALLSIPMFLLSGLVMARGSIAGRLVRLMTSLTSALPGGLGVATVLSMTLFSAISGSSMVTLLAIGGIMYPALIAAGYSQRYTLGVLCCGGTLGVIIPPSILMVVYGIVTEVSITAMFLAGWGPGLLLAALLCIYTVLGNLKVERKPFDVKEIAAAFRNGITALLMPVILLGGIYTGFFTVTESAALALLYACVVDVFVHRELNGHDLIKVFIEASKLLGTLLPLIAIASSLNVILDYEGVPQKIVRLMQEYADTKGKMMVLVNVLLLAAGALMDEISAIVILAPLLAPLGAAYGYDPVHFATIVIVNLQIGYVAPPVALNLFVAMVAFNQPFGTVARAVIPFIGLMLITLVVTVTVPELSLYLVR